MADPPVVQDLGVDNSPETLDSPPSPSNFVCPEIDLNVSLETLLSHSVEASPAASAMVEQRPPQQSSLTESWATLSDLSFDEDEHSEHTDHGSLIDVHSTGDVLSIRDEEEDTDVELEDDLHEDDDQPDTQHESVIQPPAETPLASSTAAVQAAEQVTLDEPSDPSSNATIEASKRIDDSIPSPALWLFREGNNELVSDIRMPLSNSLIRDMGKRVLRVLLFRPRNLEHLDDDILPKLGDAQLASNLAHQHQSPPSPSRFHVVPDAFGPGSQPTAAAILPVDYELECAVYEHAEFARTTEPLLNITLGDRDDPRRTQSILQTEEADGHRWKITGAQLENPDLAIIIDNQTESGRRFLHASIAFTRRHSIPTIILGVELHYDSVVETSLNNLLHVSIKDPAADDDNTRRLPLDVDTFLSLNPQQLSRHIRFLMQQQNRTEPTVNKTKKDAHWLHADIEKNVQEFQKHFRPGFHSSARGGRLLYGLLLVMGFILMNILFNVRNQWIGLKDVDYVPAPADLSSKPIASPTSTVLSTSNVSPDLAVAVGTPDASSIRERVTAPSKKKFDVEVVGHSYLVVRTSREYRVQEDLQVSVTRQGKQIAAEIRLLFPSVWEVSLDEDQAYGELCVQLSMKRPAMNETTVIYLGQQPFDVWLKTMLQETEGKMQQKLTQLQDSLENLQQEQRARSLLNSVHEKVLSVLTEVMEPLKSPELRERAQKVQETITKKAESVSKDTKAWVDGLKPGLQQSVEIANDKVKMLFDMSLKAVDGMRVKVEEYDIRGRLTGLLRTAQKGLKSDILAEAQDRAQKMTRGLRARLGRGEL
jgi:hypothetical protein